ncbi:hypothetical protein [Vibrio chagasii]|nr:hypothetical protein [Vibrio chagasii]MCY9828843.1 hypothetical protein [Vibrio chagasii]
MNPKKESSERLAKQAEARRRIELREELKSSGLDWADWPLVLGLNRRD